MSLEAAIAELVDSNRKLIDVTERLLSVRADAIETVKTAAAPKTEAAPKTKTETAPKATETAANDAAAAKMAAAAAHPLGAKILEYTTTGYDEAHAQAAEERAARVAKVKAIYASIEKQIGTPVASFADIPEAWNDTVITKIAEWTAGGPLVIKSAPSLDL